VNIQPHTEEQFIEHVQQGTEVCLVCGNELKGTWTDYNGQIRCQTCGVTYQILGCHLRQEILDHYGLTKEDIAQQYCDCLIFLCTKLFTRARGRNSRWGCSSQIGMPPVISSGIPI